MKKFVVSVETLVSDEEDLREYLAEGLCCPSAQDMSLSEVVSEVVKTLLRSILEYDDVSLEVVNVEAKASKGD